MKQTIDSLMSHAKKADFWSIYALHETEEEVSFRKGIAEPITTSSGHGALITVIKDGGLGYMSTQDLTPQGIKRAYDIAFDWANKFSHASLLKEIENPFFSHKGNYKKERQLLANTPLSDKLNLLQEIDEILLKDKAVIDTQTSIWSIDSISEYHNSLGSEIYQEINRVVPCLSATANHMDITQTRTLGGMRALCRQGSFSDILNMNLKEEAARIREEAVELTHAENCPSEMMDALIDPDQMMLQIHESIGHPIELDRILGDERNYAGTSFVSLDMFGNYQYGSNILNITFDPTIEDEFSSYAFDDEGQKAEKHFLIKDGILLRPLGGAIAQKRAQMNGVANARSSSWNRPPIDRMANLNLEPGSSSFNEMLEQIENGVYLKSNSSWSIDDSRNKFQFGCEWGQLIKNGKLTKVVRNPNYRGVSANFWRNLYMVGDDSTNVLMGSPYCGKGEPNQCIRVGHASPVCLFKDIDVFGGE